jgi:hypothetical protein
MIAIRNIVKVSLIHVPVQKAGSRIGFVRLANSEYFSEAILISTTRIEVITVGSNVDQILYNMCNVTFTPPSIAFWQRENREFLASQKK